MEQRKALIVSARMDAGVRQGLTWRQGFPIRLGRSGRACFGYLLLALSLLLSHTQLHAAPSRILILKSGPEGVYTSIVESLTTHLKKVCEKQSGNCSSLSMTTVTMNDSGSEEAEQRLQESWRLIITVGGKAATLVAQKNLTSPVLHTVLPRNTFKHLGYDRRNRKVTAIYIDQPLNRKLSLIKESMPGRERVGVLIGKSNQVQVEELKRLGARFGLTIQLGVVDDEKKIGVTLRKLLKKSDVLLALPDPTVFNQRTVKNILLSSYHNRVPVVGFSAAYVKAGAIAAVYSSPEEIGKHIGEQVGSLLFRHNGTLPPPSYPKYFSVSTNKSVADSLQILMPAARDIEARLEEKGL